MCRAAGRSLMGWLLCSTIRPLLRADLVLGLLTRAGRAAEGAAPYLHMLLHSCL